MTKQTYKLPEYEEVEFGVTGDVVKRPDPYHPLGYMLYERITFGEDGQFTCWIAPDLDVKGEYSGMWSSLTQDEANELGLK